MSQITAQEYNNLAHAFAHFNKELFNGELPDCLITLKRDQPKRLGHYQSMVVRNRTDHRATDEISLNLVSFPSRSDIEILSTLVHEMVHLWQEHLADAPRKAYHDKQWGRKMKEIGLYPSSTSAPGGKETGQQMSHYIIPDHLFDTACQALLASGYKLNWQMEIEQPEGKEKKKTRLKFTCPACEQKAWAKPGARLVCADCMETLEPEEDLTDEDI